MRKCGLRLTAAVMGLVPFFQSGCSTREVEYFHAFPIPAENIFSLGTGVDSHACSGWNDLNGDGVANIGEYAEERHCRVGEPITFIGTNIGKEVEMVSFALTKQVAMESMAMRRKELIYGENISGKVGTVSIPFGSGLEEGVYTASWLGASNSVLGRNTVRVRK